MTIKIKGLNINYTQYGKGGDILLLHGWGQNIKMMDPLGQKLKDQNRITILDLPGFGESDEPKDPWTIYSYLEMLEEFVKELNLKQITLVGHSFGGKLSILYASRNEVKNLVLLASPCFKSDHKSIKVRVLKTIKKILFIGRFGEYFKKYFGSDDYRHASTIMRKVLVNNINTDLSEDAKRISSPTILIWGDKDTAVSLEKARKLEKLIKNSALIVLPNSTHYAYLENLNQVTNIIRSLLGGKNEN